MSFDFTLYTKEKESCNFRDPFFYYIYLIVNVSTNSINKCSHSEQFWVLLMSPAEIFWPKLACVLYINDLCLSVSGEDLIFSPRYTKVLQFTLITLHNNIIVSSQEFKVSCSSVVTSTSLCSKKECIWGGELFSKSWNDYDVSNLNVLAIIIYGFLSIHVLF